MRLPDEGEHCENHRSYICPAHWLLPSNFIPCELSCSRFSLFGC
jgi:hypothetical protein